MSRKDRGSLWVDTLYAVLGREADISGWFTDRFEGLDGAEDIDERNAAREQLIAECWGLTDPC